MCALGCWWGGKITVLQVFFFSWYQKKTPKKQKKTTNLYTWRKSAHGHLYLALILQRSEQHYFSFFCLSSLWKLTKWARPHSSICDRRFSLLKFVSSHSVWIKVFHRRQSLCEAHRKPLRRSFLLVAPEPQSLFWKASCFFALWCNANNAFETCATHRIVLCGSKVSKTHQQRGERQTQDSSAIWGRK